MDSYPLGRWSVARIGVGAERRAERAAIPGTSSVQHLEENLAVADIELDDETREQLNAIAA
jgi:aryl-alcohol dehydrogenase-like predicted oxidoreductase